MLISNTYNNYYNNFGAFLNYTNKDNKIKILASLIIVGLAVAYVAYYCLCKRINAIQDLSDQDQQINDLTKQKFSQTTSPIQQKSFAANQPSSTTTQKKHETVATQQETSSTQSNQMHTNHLVNTITPLETGQVTPLSCKKNESFTFDELMTTTDLTQDELFSYAEDSCRKSAQEGLALMTRAAQMGHVEAMFIVGQLYRYGSRVGNKPVEKDISQAMPWLEKAAHAGNHKACGYLANIYLNGDGMTKNAREGAKWLLLGFKNGAKTIGIDVGNNRLILGNETQAKEYLKQNFSITVS